MLQDVVEELFLRSIRKGTKNGRKDSGSLCGQMRDFLSSGTSFPKNEPGLRHGIHDNTKVAVLLPICQ